MTDTEYEAWERFCIRTVDGHEDDINALKYIAAMYGRAMAVKIWSLLRNLKEKSK